MKRALTFAFLQYSLSTSAVKFEENLLKKKKADMKIKGSCYCKLKHGPVLADPKMV